LPAKTDPPPRWNHRPEAWGASFVFGLFGALPIEFASALGGALARAVGPRLGVSKRARRNLQAALPELGPDAIEAIIRGMWDNLGRVAAEFPHVRKLAIFSPGTRVETRGFEHIARAMHEGRRMILVAAHLANWEIAAIAGRQFGIDATHIYRAANNPLVDRLIARLRGSEGEYIPKGAIGSRQAVAALRRGGSLGLLVDQKQNEGIAVPFFGRAAMTTPAPAALALHFDCDVLMARVERLSGAQFRLTIHPPLPLPDSGDRDADTRALLATINRIIEGWIRERPEQWFWLHRRWPD
jgi:KDO2-lipid IV(A) lauroyltransferase